MNLKPVFGTIEWQDDAARVSCAEALTQLSFSSIPFLVGGTCALRHYTHTGRQTKDLDVFVLPGDVQRVLDLFQSLGYRTALPFPHCLGKVFIDDFPIDVIFSSGNAVARVDDRWFAHAVDGEVCGVPVRLCPAVEMIWSKAFVQERERFDGADVLHLLRALGPTLDWTRLLQRFGPHWRVLLGHLVFFGFVFPDERHQIPIWVKEELIARFAKEPSETGNPVCNGTLLSREQYLDDVQEGAYWDARLEPVGSMTRDELDIWTAAIDEKT